MVAESSHNPAGTDDEAMMNAILELGVPQPGDPDFIGPLPQSFVVDDAEAKKELLAELGHSLAKLPAAANSYLRKDPRSPEIKAISEGLGALHGGLKTTYHPKRNGAVMEVIRELEGADLSVARGEQQRASHAVELLKDEEEEGRARDAQLDRDGDARVKAFVDSVTENNRVARETDEGLQIRREEPDAPINPHAKPV